MSKIDWSQEKKPWVPGRRFRPLTAEQYAAEIVAPNSPDARQHALAVADWEESLAKWNRGLKIGTGVGGVGIQTMVDLSRLFGKAVEPAFVAMGRMGGDRVSMFLGEEYNSDAGKTYRYHNAREFLPVGAFVRGVKDSFMRGGALQEEYPDTFGDDAVLGRSSVFFSAINPSDSPIGHLVRGAAYAKKEMDAGFPWAKKNPEEFRNNLLDDINPLWLASPVAELYSGAKESAHLQAMMPTVERMMKAATSKKTGARDAFTIAADNLYGRDTIGEKFWQGFSSMARGGATKEDLAASLYQMGHRAPGAGPAWKDLDLSFVPDFFKRGGEGASTHIRDLAYGMMKKGQKLSDHFRNEINAAGTVSKAETNEALYLLSRVPRNAPTSLTPSGEWDTAPVTSSFLNNYNVMAYTGQVREVSPSALEYALGAVKDHTLGFESSVTWNPLLAPSKEFAAGVGDILKAPTTDKLVRNWVNKAGVAADFIDPDRFALWRAKYKTHELVLEETNGLFAKADKYRETLQSAVAQGRKDIGQAIDIFGGVHQGPATDNAKRIAAGGYDAIREAQVEISGMDRQVTGVDKLVKDFKTFTTTPDYIAELKKSEPVVVGRLITAFDTAMGYVRRPQLLNPGTQLTNFFDTNAVKNAFFGNVISGDDIVHTIQNGKAAPRYGLLGEDLNEAFTTDVAHYAYDAIGSKAGAGPLGKAVGKAEDAFAASTNAMESAGRVTLGRKVYESVAGRLIDAGMDVKAASQTALTEAMRFVDLVHVDYANLSPFEKIVRRATSLYPRFNVNDVVNYTRLAVDNGSEAYALTQVRAGQQQRSLDGKGSVQVGSAILDPFGNLSPLRAIESAVSVGRALTDDQKVAFVPFKMLEAVYGTSNPVFRSAAEAAGAAPEKNKGSQSKYDNLVSGALAYFSDGKINFAPSDVMGKMIGQNPQTARDASWAMQGQLEQAVAIRQGRFLEPKDAVRVAQIKGAGRAMLSILSPMSAGAVWASPEEGQVMDLIRKGNDQIALASDDHKDLIKDGLLAQPEYKGLAPFLSKTPGDKLRMAGNDATMGEILSVAQSEIRNPASMGAMTDRALASIGGAAANVVHTMAPGLSDPPPPPVPGTPPPDDEETYQWPVKREDGTDYPTGAVTRVTRPNGGVDFGKEALADGSAKRFTEAPNLIARLSPQSKLVQIVLDPKHIGEDLNMSALLNYDVKARIQAVRSDEAIRDVVDAYGAQGLPILKMIQSAASVDGEFWRPVYEGYIAAATGGAEGGFREAPRGAIATTRAALGIWYDQKLRSAPSREIEGMLRWDVQTAREALKADILAGRGPVGVDYSRVDTDIAETMTTTNLAMIKAKYGPEAGGQMIARRSFEEDRAFPGNKILRDRLQDAVRGTPQRVSEVVDATNAAIAAGTAGGMPVSADWWKTTAAVHPGLYESAAVRDNYAHILEVRDNISLFDTRNKPYAVSMPLLIEHLAEFPGDAATISFLRQGGLKDGSDGRIQAAAAGWEGFVAQLPPEVAAGIPIKGLADLDAYAPVDPGFSGERAVQDFNLRTGVDTNTLYEKLDTWTPAETSLAQGADIRTANLTPSVAPRSEMPAPIEGGAIAAPRSQAPAMSYAPPSFASLRSSTMRTSGTAADYNTIIPREGHVPRGIITPAQPFGMDKNGRMASSGLIPWLNDGMAQSERTGRPLAVVLSQTAVTQNGTASVDGYKAASAVTSLAGAAQNMALGFGGEEYAASDAGRGISGGIAGASAGLGVYAGLAALGMTGVGLPIAAVGFGIVAGLQAGGVFGGKKQSRPDNSAEYLKLQQERQRLEEERFAEQLRQTSVRDLRTRESDLVRAMGSMTPAQRAAVQPQLAAFQRRPSFQSRIGLVDAAERAVGSAIKPRW